MIPPNTIAVYQGISTGYQPNIKVFCTPDIMNGHPFDIIFYVLPASSTFHYIVKTS